MCYHEPAKSDVEEANKKENHSDESLKKGMVMQRSTTDCFMCLAFLVFIAGMVGVASYGFANGDPEKIITPLDADGNQCGLGDFADYPYLYIVQVEASASTDVVDMSTSVCVSNCSLEQGDKTDCALNSEVTECPYVFYNYTTYLDRYCFPDSEAAASDIMEALGNNTFATSMADLSQTPDVYIYMPIGVIVVTFLYIFALKYFVRPLLYISFISILVILTAGGAFSYTKKDDYETTDQNYNYCLYGAYVAWVLAGIYFIVLCCCWRNIRIAAAITETASDFLIETPKIILIPLVTWLLLVVWIAAWTYIAAYIYSVGDIEKDDTLPIANIVWNDTTYKVWWYHLFGLFWISAFISGVSDFIIACTTCQWYFTGAGSDTSDTKGYASVSLSIWWSLRYHLGTVAFGALVIAIVNMIQVLFEYARKKYEKMAPTNALTKAIICCLRCIVWCVNKCVKFITKNAWIQCSLTSKAFCPSAWAAFCLIIRNAGRFSMVAMVETLAELIGKGLIMSLCGVGTYFYTDSAYGDVIANPYGQVFVIMVLAYLVASVFLAIFTFTASTILQCFLLDEEVGGGRRTPDALQTFLDVHVNKKDDDKKDGDEPKQNDMA